MFKRTVKINYRTNKKIDNEDDEGKLKGSEMAKLNERLTSASEKVAELSEKSAQLKATLADRKKVALAAFTDPATIQPSKLQKLQNETHFERSLAIFGEELTATSLKIAKIKRISASLKEDDTTSPAKNKWNKIPTRGFF